MGAGNVNQSTDLCWKDLNQDCLGVIARLNVRLCALRPSKLTLPGSTLTGDSRATLQPSAGMISSLPMRGDLE
jgi:hypothetical protein